MISLVAVVAGLAALYAVISICALVQHQRRGECSKTNRLQDVSVVQPLCGARPELERCLRSTFQQDYPSFEVLLCVESDSDSAIPVARRVMGDFPHVPSSLLILSDFVGFENFQNPKMRNIQSAFLSSQSDLILILDSNVRVGPSHLREMVETIGGESVGVVTSPIRGHGAGLGSALENAYLRTVVSPSLAISNRVFGQSAIVGKSMLFRRAQFAALGGLVRVGDFLAEDYVIGQLFQDLGLRTVLVDRAIENQTSSATVKSYLARQLRWAMMRARLMPAAYVFEPLMAPLVVATLCGAVTRDWGAAFGWGIAAHILRELAAEYSLSGNRPAFNWSNVVRMLLASVLRDLLGVVVWMLAPFRRHVEWRGNRLRMQSQTRLVPIEPANRNLPETYPRHSIPSNPDGFRTEGVAT